MKTILTFLLNTLFVLSLSAQYQFDRNVHSVTPSSGPVAGGTTVRIEGNVNFIVPDPCGAPQVYVGGAQVAVTAYDDTSITFTTPPYTTGTFNVVVDRCGNRGVLKNAFTFTNDTRTWEGVLLPVYLQNDLPGAFGSLWRTTLNVFDLNNDVFFRGRSNGPAEQHSYGPITTVVDTDQHQPGRLVYVSPSYAAKLLRFNLNVRDLSREASTLGTELRPVYEDDAFGPYEGFALANVPLGDPYRQKLRVYRMDIGKPATVNMVFYDAARKDIGFVSIDSSSEPPNGDFQIYPGYFEIDLDRLPQLAGKTQATIEISVPAGRWWGYVSVTNNITQQVTTITP